MSSLTRFDQDGLELVIDTKTGEAFASVSAVARMCNRNHSVISRFAGSAKFQLKEAEILTPGGLQGVALLTENHILEIVSKYKPELVLSFAKLGLRATLHKLAGYEVVSKPVTPVSYLDALKALVAVEEEKERLRIENEELTVEVEQLSEVVDELFDYSSIIRVAKFNGVSEKNFNWRKLKQASQLKDLEIKKVPCPRYGEKNLYSHTAWMLAYPEVKLPEVNYLTKIN